MGKINISNYEAGVELLKSIDNDFEDRIYEFAQELCNKKIKEIESKYNIIGADGTSYNSNEDEVCWYDEYREDFIKAVFEKIYSMIE